MGAERKAPRAPPIRSAASARFPHAALGAQPFGNRPGQPRPTPRSTVSTSAVAPNVGWDDIARRSAKSRVATLTLLVPASQIDSAEARPRQANPSPQSSDSWYINGSEARKRIGDAASAPKPRANPRP